MNSKNGVKTKWNKTINWKTYTIYKPTTIYPIMFKSIHNL